MNSKLKLLKIIEILKTTDEDHPLTAIQIGEKLRLLYGIEAERKSICRDINLLKDYADYDIIASADNKKGYFLASREFEDWEVKILLDAVWSAKFLTSDHAAELENKLYTLVNESSQKLLKRSGLIKFKHKSPTNISKYNIENILTAIKKNRQISFNYTYTDNELKPQLRRQGLAYIVNPYALIWQNEQYYLIANYPKYDNLSYYRLERMQNLEICEQKRKSLTDILGANADLQLEEYIRSSLYHFGGEKIKLTLQVKADMFDDLIDYFGQDLHINRVDADYYQVKIDVLDSEGLYFWLLQYETNVKVIEPASVRVKLLKKVEDILHHYQ